MKEIIFALLLIAPLSLIAQGKYAITGTVPDDSYEGKMIYLREFDNSFELAVVDSALVKNKSFVLKGTVVDAPKVGLIASETNENGSLQSIVILEPGNIQIEVVYPSKQNIGKIAGTVTNNEFQQFNTEQQKLVQQLTEVSGQADPKHAQLVEQLYASLYNFARKNIKNQVGEFFLLQTADSLDKKQLGELFAETRSQFKEGQIGKEINGMLQSRSFSIGDSYADVKLKNQEGKEIALSDYVGKSKFVLIDFWASWCAPCIKEMPTVAAAYSKYKSKGFEIVAISLDDNESRWMRAIKSLNMTWINMSDLAGWKSQAAQLYGVKAIPLTLLVDGEGKVVAKNLRGEQLLSKLEELLK